MLHKNKNKKNLVKKQTYVFDPFIHGTSSIIFSRLPKTQMQLISPVEMIKKYKVAPPGGEISKGGLKNLRHKSKPCFGLLSSQNSSLKPNSKYTLKRIIKEYTKGPTFKTYNANLIKLLKYEFHSTTLERSFNNLNVLLIYIARAKARKINVNKVLGEKNVEKLIEQGRATYQYFYFLLLIGKIIHPNFKAINSLSIHDKYDLKAAVCETFSYKSLVEKIIRSNIDLKQLYENPTTEGFKQLSVFLKLPKSIVLPPLSLYGKSGEINLILREPFLIKYLKDTLYPSDIRNFRNPKYTVPLLLDNSPHFSINGLLEMFCSKELKPDFFREIEEDILKHAKTLNNRLNLLEELLEKDFNEFAYSHNDRKYLKNPFPLILICEDKNKIKLIDKETQEYRALQTLVIGRDIKLIATDTERNSLKVKEFLRENKIDNVRVILFEQLKECKKTKAYPLGKTASQASNVQRLLSIGTIKKTKTSSNKHKPISNKIQRKCNPFKAAIINNEKKSKMSSMLIPTLMIMSVSSVIALLVSLNLLFSMLVGLGVGSIFLASQYARSRIYMHAAKSYDTPNKIKTIRSKSERQSLISGLRSHTWKGYFSSYSQLSTYRHPMAFGAGCALRGSDSKLKKSINKLLIR